MPETNADHSDAIRSFGHYNGLLGAGIAILCILDTTDAWRSLILCVPAALAGGFIGTSVGVFFAAFCFSVAKRRGETPK